MIQSNYNKDAEWTDCIITQEPQSRNKVLSEHQTKLTVVGQSFVQAVETALHAVSGAVGGR